MATISFEYKEGNKEALDSFVDTMKDKLSNDNFISNPYKGNVYNYSKDKRNIYILSLEPIYPLMVLIFPTLLMVGLILLLSWSYWLFLIPASIGSLILFFYSNTFFYIFFLMGLKKAKVTVKLKRVYVTELINLLVQQNGK